MTAVQKKQKKQRPGWLLREPKAISAAQIIINFAAAGSGLLAALGGSPVLITGQIGPFLAFIVGAVLIVGGITGALAVLLGHWWLERVALLVMGLGWVMLLPASLTYALSGRSTGVWLVVALIFAALGDVYKRYRRIEWAYLDPAR
jgi:hypothetical protein